MTISGKSTVRDAMKNINRSGAGVAFVIDSDDKLLGIVTDGDIRRFIIKDQDIEAPVSRVMNPFPVVASAGDSRDKVIALMNDRIRHIPIVDDDNVLTDIFLYKDLEKAPSQVTVVRARAPLRVSFAGGGTDVAQYFRNYGGTVLSTTINKYCYGTIVKRKDSKINITSFDFDQKTSFKDIKEVSYDGKLNLIKAVIKIMQPDFGFDIYTYSDVPPESGLGASAAIAAVVAGLLNYFREEKLDDYQLAEIAYRAEREEMKIKGGWQDQYATIFGGFNFMEFNKEGDVVIHPLRIRKDILYELDNSLILCYTGKTLSSARIHEVQTASVLRKEEDVIKALKRLNEITIRVKSSLLRGKMKEFGKLLHEAWENKKRLSPKISDPKINNLYTAGLNNGALGGKLLGAGGGGYLIFFCPPMKRHDVKKALEKAGGTIHSFDFDRVGMHVWPAKETKY